MVLDGNTCSSMIQEATPPGSEPQGTANTVIQHSTERVDQMRNMLPPAAVHMNQVAVSEPGPRYEGLGMRLFLCLSTPHGIHLFKCYIHLPGRNPCEQQYYIATCHALSFATLRVLTHQYQVPLPLRVQLTKTLNGGQSIWDLKSIKK